MYNSTDSNSPFDSNSPALDMAYLQELLRQQAQRRPIYENIAILGCGYVGTALADYWQEQGHFVTGTTTSRGRIAALSRVVSRAVLMKGDDTSAVQSLLEGIYNLVDDSQLTVKEQVKRVCSKYGLPPVQWDASKPSRQTKSVRISNQKLKAAGYQLTHPQLSV